MLLYLGIVFAVSLLSGECSTRSNNDRIFSQYAYVRNLICNGYVRRGLILEFVGFVCTVFQ